MKIFFGFCFAFFLLLIPQLKCQSPAADSSRLKLDQLVENRLLKPVREIHNKLDLNAFSRAYNTESYLYEVYTGPDKKLRYYTCAMKVVRGAFIIERYEFKADLIKSRIEVLDEKTKRYLPSDKWLDYYRDKVAQDEKNKK